MQTALLGYGRARRRKLIAAAGLLAAATIAAVDGSVGANLPGSTFEGNDGNFTPQTGTDWTSPTLTVVNGPDTPSGTGDTAFGRGTAENDVNVTVVTGSIPNNKADLANFLVASEQGANGHTYLYLGWTRANQGGTTNFDFEINKLAQPDLSTAGPKTLNRSTGDLLVNYLFQGQIGNDVPTVEIRTWTGTAWSAPVTGVVAESAISTASQTNPFGDPNPVPIGQFGEAAIDLTASGIIPEGECEGFSSAYVKTRASTSFQSEVKDLVPPQHIDLFTCATITVKKVTVPSPDPTNTTFEFTADYRDPAVFTLLDGGEDTVEGLNPGTYSVAETDPGSQWAVTSECDDGESTVDAIILQNNEHVTCTFTNTLQTGAIEVIKTRKHAADGPGPHPHAGVTFTIAGETVVTDAAGRACVDGLLFGTYDAVETVPAGYSADQATTQSATVDNFATCDGVPYAGETLNFANTPLTNISVTVDSQVDGGTASTVVCTGTAINGSTGANGDGTFSENNLEPGTYTCTITIDP